MSRIDTLSKPPCYNVGMEITDRFAERLKGEYRKHYEAWLLRREQSDEPDEPEEKPDGDVYLSDLIWSESTTRVVEQLKRNAEAKVESTVRIDSPGGDALNAIMLSEAINRYGAKVRGEGAVMSAAAKVFFRTPLENRSAAKGTVLMVHPPYSLMGGSAEELRSQADALDRIQAETARAMAETTSLTLKQAEKMVAKETYLDYDEMVELGMIPDTENADEESEKEEADVGSKEAKKKRLSEIVNNTRRREESLRRRGSNG